MEKGNGLNLVLCFQLEENMWRNALHTFHSCKQDITQDKMNGSFGSVFHYSRLLLSLKSTAR